MVSAAGKSGAFEWDVSGTKHSCLFYFYIACTNSVNFWNNLKNVFGWQFSRCRLSNDSCLCITYLIEHFIFIEWGIQLPAPKRKVLLPITILSSVVLLPSHKIVLLFMTLNGVIGSLDYTLALIVLQNRFLEKVKTVMSW